MRDQEIWKRSSNDLLRKVVDGDGRDWEVFEMTAPPHDRVGGCVLVFASQEVVRRIRDYPLDWHRLEPQALLSMCKRE